MCQACEQEAHNSEGETQIDNFNIIRQGSKDHFLLNEKLREGFPNVLPKLRTEGQKLSRR